MGTQELADVKWWQDPTSEMLRGRYFGTYHGVVKDVSDPIKAGRVRIHCGALLPGNENQARTWLPWALPKGGALNVPPLDAPVSVTFEQGLIQYPVYEWGWLPGENERSSAAPLAGKEQNDPTWKAERTQAAGGSGPSVGSEIPADTARATRPTYARNKVFQSETGHILELDDSAGPRARYQHPSGSSILIDPDGSVHIRAAGAIYNEPRGDYVVSLRRGAAFRVVYDEGPGVYVGPAGVHLNAHTVAVMNRFVRKNGESI